MIHKFKGFTLIEVLVVFVLSSFVVALIMYVYLLITQFYNTTKNKDEIYNEVLFCSKLLRTDFEEAEYVTIESDRIVFKYYSFDNKTYSIKDNFIVRQSDLSIDTLRINIKSFSTFYKMIPKSNGYVDQLTLEINDKDSPFVLCFKKDYAMDKLNEFSEKQ